MDAHPVCPVGGRRKRAGDALVAGVALVALAPALALIALWVRLDSAGPALFRQRRVGAFGHEFVCLKFRSMIPGAEQLGAGLALAGPADPRITRAGRILRRWSLDELPQLWNVLRGEMSLVGPRPTVPAQVAHYDSLQRRRLWARPGLTGLAQVEGRAALPWSERIARDVVYVEHWSFGGDVRILWQTVRVVLSGRGLTGEGFDLVAGE